LDEVFGEPFWVFLKGGSIWKVRGLKKGLKGETSFFLRDLLWSFRTGF